MNNYYPSGTSMAESPRRTDQGVQPYKFGGKELDRFNTLDYYDFEARAFDPTLMRFTRPDPLAEKYYSVSPYVYYANNPVRYVDPDGKDIRIRGNEEFQKQVFEDMQKLTSSSLLMLKNGKVIEASNYNEKRHGAIMLRGEGIGNKEFGTTVISELIGSKYTISINKGTKDNFDNYTTDAFKQNGKDGKGSGGDVLYDTKDEGSTSGNADGTTGRPAYIGLSHELVHGWHAVKGQVMSIKPGFKSDPDRSGPGLFDLTGISGEEYITRQEENIIRKEQRVKLRAIPK